MSQNLSSAAVVIGALRVNLLFSVIIVIVFYPGIQDYSWIQEF